MLNIGFKFSTALFYYHHNYRNKKRLKLDIYIAFLKCNLIFYVIFNTGVHYFKSPSFLGKCYNVGFNIYSNLLTRIISNKLKHFKIEVYNYIITIKVKNFICILKRILKFKNVFIPYSIKKCYLLNDNIIADLKLFILLYGLSIKFINILVCCSKLIFTLYGDLFCFKLNYIVENKSFFNCFLNSTFLGSLFYLLLENKFSFYKFKKRIFMFLNFDTFSFPLYNYSYVYQPTLKKILKINFFNKKYLTQCKENILKLNKIYDLHGVIPKKNLENTYLNINLFCDFLINTASTPLISFVTKKYNILLLSNNKVINFFMLTYKT